MGEPIVDVRLMLSEAVALLRAAKFAATLGSEGITGPFPRPRAWRLYSRAENRLRVAIEAARGEAKR